MGKKISQTGTACKKRIMVIDNDRDFSQDMEKLLYRENYNVAVVDAAEVALLLLNSVSPDLIIIDSSGNIVEDFEAVEKIRSRSKVPVIMIVWAGIMPDIEEAVEKGIDDLITKPFDTRVLRARIRAILRRSGVQYAGERQSSISF